MLKSSYWIACALSFVALACGEDPGPVSAGDPALTSDAGTGPDGGCYDGQTNSCTCSDAQHAGKTGTQTCYSNTWLLCNCNDQTLTPPTTAGSCLPGAYEGNFSGLYFSGFSPGGIPVPVIGIDVSGLPPLKLTLTEGVRADPSQEFPTYSVSDGIVKGTADGIFPFEGTITGDLDCASKLFKGTFKGWYSLLFEIGIDVNKGFFEGPVTAVYDGATHTFKPGTWDVLELAGQGGAGVGMGWGVQIAKLGGNGDWWANYKGNNTTTPDAGVPDAGP